MPHEENELPIAMDQGDRSTGTQTNTRGDPGPRNDPAYEPSPLSSQTPNGDKAELSERRREKQPLQQHAPAQSFASASFPFNAEPGSAGPSPTTYDLAFNSAQSSPTAVEKKPGSFPGTATPPDQRSVQFARKITEDSPRTPLAKSTVPADEDGADEAPYPQRQGSFFTKLKAFASPAASSHARTSSAATDAVLQPSAMSPQSERSEPIYEMATEERESEAEADEDSEEQDTAGELRPRKPQKRKRPATASGSGSLPATPRTSRFASFMRDHPLPGSSNRPSSLSRRATMSDMDEDGRAGVSEDEGRDRLRNAFRKGIEGARGLSYGGRRQHDPETPDGKRPGNLRRLTGFGGADSRQNADRHNNQSAQRWRQVKAGLKMIGQRRKEERIKVDYQKSAQLMAELLAGAPAALIFASMFQRDEHHHKKVPVLLEQLKISIPSVKANTDKKGDRDYIFQIDLEYGNGPARLQWTIFRSINDFANLHFKYKAQSATDKVRHFRSEDRNKAKIPRFPKSAIPYARGMRGLFEKVQDEDDEQDANQTPNLASPNEQPTASGSASVATTGNTSAARGRPGKHKRRMSSFAPPRRSSTGDMADMSLNPELLNEKQLKQYAERSRKKLEVYLQQMIRWLIFRPDSTRLCKFLELSAMAIRLSAENGYQGKQGLLQIASRQHRELRRKTIEQLRPSAFKERHKRRWFLVRHSYIVCVDGPESLKPYDVFLVDSDFAIEKRKSKTTVPKTGKEIAKIAADATPTKKAHLLRLYNAERKLKLYARNEKQYLQFKDSLSHMMQNTIWAEKKRYDSFAPVRNNVWARWLVDGRDHMWQVSRAIDKARDFIYIHDWWLSPDLYMRRPAAISQKWRLDRLLQRKASEGVKVFVIVYRNIESAIPIDSEYTKWSLLDLHPNICVQRSPNQFRQNQFFWAHHEKLVVIDNMMAFVGGIDLCFGRWDDPCHSLTDDKLTGFEDDLDVPRDSEHCQMWPGKDYSNPRVQDFYALDRPYEEMYDRTKVPRMPWHDISMQLVGQPARDVGRHFIQRWNYVLRSRVPSRPTPVLMPPPEYEQEELERLGMTGTCQVQILRSCSPWSIGTPNKVEHSIMNAYCDLIEKSQHFVYIENQFFVSSCTVVNTKIHNKIGNALVERAIRAHENNEEWQACLIIPLMPGFQNTVDSQDGTSVRLIMLSQYYSICRGEDSIWARLQARGIDPEDYIRFYSLRQWGKIGPRKCLTTEQLYIHAKCMIVDDRTVIIGSANINERSMLGSRDSEVAAVVTDTRLIPSVMAGKPFEVGEFPHTLRKRLQREHLGIDVDAIYRREQLAAERAEQDLEMDRIYRPHSTDFVPSKEYFETPTETPQPELHHAPFLRPTTQTTAGHVDESSSPVGITQTGSSGKSSETLDAYVKETKQEREHDLDVDGYGVDNMKRLVASGNEGLRDSFVDVQGREVLLKKDAPDVDRLMVRDDSPSSRGQDEWQEAHTPAARPPWPTERLETYAMGLPTRSTLPQLPTLDDSDIGGPPLTRGLSETSQKSLNPFITSIRRPTITEDCMTDPIASRFFHEIWHQVAENNTKIYRQVFRCQPDSEVLDWKAYEKFNEYNERFMQSQGLGASKAYPAKGAPGQSGPPGSVGTDFAAAVPQAKGMLNGFMNKLRPGSSKMADGARNESVGGNGKDPEKGVQGPRMPSTPLSGTSSDPTAVPSSEEAPIDEKVAAQQDDAINEKPAQQAEGGIEHRRTVQYSEKISPPSETTATQTLRTGTLEHSSSQKRRRRATTKSSARPAIHDDVLSRDDAEELLNLVQGHVVLWPYEWLEKEEKSGNWLYSIDQIAPIEIYD